MKRVALVSIVIVAALVVGIVLFVSNQSPKDQDIPKTTETQNQPSGAQTHQVQITDTGFVPKTFTINQGDSVTWTNARESASWPASARHPSHTIYPGSGIEKCGTPEAETIFDACEGLEQGQSYTFTFNEVGSWDYHDHLVLSQSGRIIVSP